MRKKKIMKTYSCTIGGKDLVFEVGKYAPQANASLTVRYGDTVVLATITKSSSARDGIDYFPLMVDYSEKLYASGKIKGSRFIKREGRPSDEAVTNGRMIDRSLRPLFDQRIKEDVQVIVTILSYDNENDADVVAITAASAAAAISDIAYHSAVAGVRVGRVNGEFVVNPTVAQKEESDLDLVVASNREKVVMLEGDAAEVSEEDFVEGILLAKKEAQALLDVIDQMVSEVGKEKTPVEAVELPQELRDEIKAFADSKLEDVLYLSEKQDRKHGLKVVMKEIADEFVSKYADHETYGELPLKGLIMGFVYQLAGDLISTNIIESEKRIDKRKVDEIRPLSAEIDLLPRPHGTGYFKRGETHVLTVATLAGPGMAQIIDDMEVEHKKFFMHHYSFPPFSVGEAQPLRGPSRRDIGHGMLAEKAIARLIPSREDFPYTIRLFSEVTSSNGSSSMAATCGSSLALMHAGVPIPKHVAGVAMGIAQKDGKYKILTDLQDLEDSEGGMDFKLAGTRDGVTAVQLDVKSDGLTDDMVRDTVMQNKKARHEILDVLESAIKEPRKEMSPYAPRITKIQIDPDKIGEVIGPGGKVITGIIDETGVEIDIEDSGLVIITSTDSESAKKAEDMVNAIVKEPEVGEVYTGKVVKVADFGAFVNLFGNTDGLIHISKLSKERVNKVTDVVNQGDMVEVKIVEIDKMGRINLMLIAKK